MVHFPGYAAASYLGVEVEGHVEHRGIHRQGYKFALRGEHHDFRCEKVELEGVEEVERIRFGVVENVLDGVEPRV